MPLLANCATARPLTGCTAFSPVAMPNSDTPRAWAAAAAASQGDGGVHKVELRELLRAWRDAKASAWKAAVDWAVRCGLALLVVLSAVQTKQRIESARMELLKSAVESMYSVVAGYHAMAVAGEMSMEDAQAAAKQAVKVSRFGGADGRAEYFYLWSTDGVSVMHPIRLEWAGQNKMEALKDGKGRFTLKDIVSGLLASMARPRPGGIYNLADDAPAPADAPRGMPKVQAYQLGVDELRAVAASSGLGYLSLKAMRGFQVDVIFLAIAIIGLLGLITDQLFRFLRLRIAAWAQ